MNAASTRLEQVRSFLRALGPTAIALSLQVVAFAITARQLGVDQFGTYTPLLALSAIGVELVGLGSADVLVRGVARNRGTFPFYFGNLVALTALSFPIVILVLSMVAAWPMGSPLPFFELIGILVGEILMGRASASAELIMVAHQRTTLASWIRTTSAGTRLFAVILYFTFFGCTSLSGWIWIAFGQSVLLVLAYFLLCIRTFSPPIFMLRQLELGISFGLNQIARATQASVDRVILAHFATNDVLGAYGAASRVLQLGLFPIQVMTRILYPQFFVHGAQGAMPAFRYAIRTIPIMLLVGCSAGLAVAAGGWSAPFVLGGGYSDSTDIAIKLSVALPIIAMQFPAADALTGAGKQAFRAFIFMIVTVFFGLLLAIGSYFGNINGVIIGFVCGHSLLAVVLWVSAYTFATGNQQPPAEIGSTRKQSRSSARRK